MDAGCQANCLTLLSSLASSFTSSHQKQSLNGVHKLVLFHTDLLSATSFWVWLVGEDLTEQEQSMASKGTIFIPFSQFPPKKTRLHISQHSINGSSRFFRKPEFL